MNYQRSSLRTRLPGTVAIGVAVALGVYVMAFFVLASSHDRLVEEDGIIETTTALVFLGAALIGTIAMLTTGARRLYWLVPAFGLFGFLDEMSFGARIFGFPLPVIDGLEVDSFHDVFDLADRLAGDLGISRTMIALLLVSVAALAVTYLLKTGRIRRIPAWFSHHRPILLWSRLLACCSWVWHSISSVRARPPDSPRRPPSSLLQAW